eukprot:scaffold764_cov248-Pinguiococcus_pyrenoidosus.AAC.15
MTILAVASSATRGCGLEGPQLHRLVESTREQKILAGVVHDGLHDPAMRGMPARSTFLRAAHAALRTFPCAHSSELAVAGNILSTGVPSNSRIGEAVRVVACQGAHSPIASDVVDEVSEQSGHPQKVSCKIAPHAPGICSLMLYLDASVAMAIRGLLLGPSVAV